MKLRTRILLTSVATIFIVALSFSSASAWWGVPDDDFTSVVNGLRMKAFPPANGIVETMIIVLPGDGWSSYEKKGYTEVDYIIEIAESFEGPGYLPIALSRPGTHLEGKTSYGTHSFKRGAGTLYQKSNVERIEEAIVRLKAHYAARRVVVYGHSGGGAIGLAVLGKHPGLLDGVFGIGATGNVKKWRKEMGHSNWSVLNGEDFLADVPASANIMLVTGTRDNTVPARFSKRYVELAQARGLKAAWKELNGGHNIADSSRTMRTFMEWLATLPPPADAPVVAANKTDDKKSGGSAGHV